MGSRGFASDNNAGVHPEVLKAIGAVNSNHVKGYGDDDYTRQAIHLLKAEFGTDISVFFVFNGTGANVLALQAMCRSYDAVIATTVSHINTDECGAPEKFSGAKILAVATPDGKLRIKDIEQHLHAKGVVHHSQPKVVSITQSTELGTVYSLRELKDICAYAHQNGLLVHMDGARLANAAASLGVTLKSMTADVGVDALSFGGTKNGMMMGEAVVFFNAELAHSAGFIQKQSAQLMSKMRFVSAQFIAMLTDGLWHKNAQHANQMAQLLAQKIADIPQITITQPVESNGVFVRIPSEAIEVLQASFFFYVWDHHTSEVRWMTAFDTTSDDIDAFVLRLKEVLG